jgi:O-acetyl-ADP-ribose deacetylase (regulator of RNase III)
MIKHIKCDIFESGADYILHQVNCQGVMGSGVAKQVKDKFPKVYDEYKKWCNTIPLDVLLGHAQFVNTQEDYNTSFKGIINLFAQNNFGYDGNRYTNYDALRNSLEWVKGCVFSNKTIAIPYLMSCHRGGGDWNVVYKMIEEIFKDHNVLICEYDGGRFYV